MIAAIIAVAIIVVLVLFHRHRAVADVAPPGWSDRAMRQYADK